MFVRVLSLCCDQARPPAGDLGRGGAVVEKRKREERHVVVVRGWRRKMGYSGLLVVAKYGEILQHSRHRDSLTISPSIQLVSVMISFCQ